MAKNDDRRIVVVQFIQVFRDGSHRNQPRALDAADRMLFRLPHVDQTNRRAAVESVSFTSAGVISSGNSVHHEIYQPVLETALRPGTSHPLVILVVNSSASNSYYLKMKAFVAPYSDGRLRPCAPPAQTHARVFYHRPGCASRHRPDQFHHREFRRHQYAARIAQRHRLRTAFCGSSMPTASAPRPTTTACSASATPAPIPAPTQDPTIIGSTCGVCRGRGRAWCSGSPISSVECHPHADGNAQSDRRCHRRQRSGGRRYRQQPRPDLAYSPTCKRAAADVVIGQADFTHNGTSVPPTAKSLRGPDGRLDRGRQAICCRHPG